MQPEKSLLYQIRIDITEEESKKIREKESSSLNANLISILNKIKAKLICQFEAFSAFVNECELQGDIDNPLYKWTKDTIEDKHKKIKYLKSFTIYVDGNQLYEKKIADYLEEEIKGLNDKNIIKISKYNSDPKNNPQPPKKYL